MKKKLCVLLLTLVFTNVVSANVPAPFSGGYAGVEPAGLEKLTISKQRITIDLLNLETYRTFTDKNTVVLEILYEIENKDGEKTLELIFPTIKTSKFFIDDAEISPTVEKAAPQTVVGWTAPNKTLWAEGRQIDFSTINRVDCQDCSIYKFTMPSGRHTLKITQELIPSSNFTGGLTKYWQFAYIFLPPEKRANVAATDIEIKTPPGWEAYISPDIKSDGNRSVSFASVTEKSITVTTTLPLPANRGNARIASEIFFWFALVIYPLTAFALGWFWLAHGKLWWLWGILFTFSWAALVVVALYLDGFAPEYAIPSAHQVSYGYDGIGTVIAMIVFGAAALIAGFPLWLCVWLLARNFNKKAA